MLARSCSDMPGCTRAHTHGRLGTADTGSVSGDGAGVHANGDNRGGGSTYRRRLLEHLLVASLHTARLTDTQSRRQEQATPSQSIHSCTDNRRLPAVSLEQIHRVPVRVREHLELDVPRAHDVPADQA
jgi:hypothetical protein